MTNEQKAQEWVDEWKQQRFPFIEGEVYYSLDNAISFAAFCLDKREEESRHEQGRLEAIINYTSNPERMVLTDFVAELTGMEVKEIVKKYKKYQKP